MRYSLFFFGVRRIEHSGTFLFMTFSSLSVSYFLFFVKNSVKERENRKGGKERFTLKKNSQQNFNKKKTFQLNNLNAINNLNIWFFVVVFIFN